MPPAATDHERVRLLAVELRDLYADVSGSSDRSEVRVRAVLATIERAWTIIDAVTDREGRIPLSPELGPGGY